MSRDPGPVEPRKQHAPSCTTYVCVDGCDYEPAPRPLGLPVLVVEGPDGNVLAAYPDPYDAKHLAQRLEQETKKEHPVRPGRLIIVGPPPPPSRRRSRQTRRGEGQREPNE